MEERIEKLMEQFMLENPYGDSMELATFMYKKGKEDAYEDAYYEGYADGFATGFVC